MDITKTESLPLAIAGTWENARRWYRAAGQFEQCKLFCQVMLGFELLALKKTLNIAPGGDRRSEEAGSKYQDGILIWENVLQKELGIPWNSAYRFMQMARAAMPRLRKMPELRGFDPLALPPAQWPERQSEALKRAVHKMTDGVTQKEFGEQLGLWKVPQGEHGGNPNACGKRALTAAEKAAKIAQFANDTCKRIQEEIYGLGIHFAALPDEDLHVTIDYLDSLSHLLKWWTNTPPERRDVEELRVRWAKAFKP